MVQVRLITEDEWDSWEPLVAGVPLCLRIILFCHLLLLIALFIVVVTAVGYHLASAGWPAGLQGLTAFPVAGQLLALALWLVSVLGAYRLRAWALLSLALINLLLFVGVILCPLLPAT